jgi:hypothetical protein
MPPLVDSRRAGGGLFPYHKRFAELRKEDHDVLLAGRRGAQTDQNVRPSREWRLGALIDRNG